MAHLCIAYIPPQHYDAFRRILNDHVPNTYYEWWQFHVQKAANIIDAGNTYREIQIDPHEFALAYDRHQVERNLQGLDRFAELKAVADAKKRRKPL